MTRRGFNLIELIVVMLVLGILCAIVVPRYLKVIEHGRAAEAESIFEKARAGFQARVFENLSVSAAVWSPGIAAGTDAAWRAIGMENPNANPRAFFAYAVWDSAASAGAPVSGSATNSVVAFRRTAQAAYTGSYNASQWLYMDLDTGRVAKSATYI